MPEQNNTENPALDTEDWEIAFEPFEGHPGPALTLGFNFTVLKSYIAQEPLKLQEAIAGLDCAITALFQHTQFHEIAYGLFHRLVEGKLTLKKKNY